MKFLSRLLAVIVAGGLLICAYGGYVNPHTWLLPSLATLVLPIAAIATVVVLILLLLVRQWWAALLVLLAMVLSWPSLRLVAPIHFSTPTAEWEGDTLRILTMNVASFRWYDPEPQPSASMRYILDEDADIVVLQEACYYFSFNQYKTVRPMLQEFYRKYPYRSRGLFDTGILSKYPIHKVSNGEFFNPFSRVKYESDSAGLKFARAWDVDAPGGTLRIIDMHLQSFLFSDDDRHIIDSAANANSGRKQRLLSVFDKMQHTFVAHAYQAKQLRQLIDNTDGDLLVVGDMNDTPASYAYRKLRGGDLKDAWADAGHGFTYTFRDHHMLVKIDHILYRGKLFPISCYRDKAGDSDHYPLKATFIRKKATTNKVTSH